MGGRESTSRAAPEPTVPLKFSVESFVDTADGGAPDRSVESASQRRAVRVRLERLPGKKAFHVSVTCDIATFGVHSTLTVESTRDEVRDEDETLANSEHISALLCQTDEVAKALRTGLDFFACPLEDKAVRL